MGLSFSKCKIKVDPHREAILTNPSNEKIQRRVFYSIELSGSVLKVSRAPTFSLDPSIPSFAALLFIPQALTSPALCSLVWVGCDLLRDPLCP